MAKYAVRYTEYEVRSTKTVRKTRSCLLI